MMIDSLPRREREIFELLCSAGEATAAEMRAAMQDPPSYSAVRTLLARLEARGVIKHRIGDQAYVYQERAAAGEGPRIGDEADGADLLRRIGGQCRDRPAGPDQEPVRATRATPCRRRSTKQRSVSDGRVLLWRDGLEIGADRRRRPGARLCPALARRVRPGAGAQDRRRHAAAAAADRAGAAGAADRGLGGARGRGARRRRDRAGRRSRLCPRAGAAARRAPGGAGRSRPRRPSGTIRRRSSSSPIWAGC